MTKLVYTHKVSIQKNAIKLVIPIAIARLLELTPSDKVCFRAGKDIHDNQYLDIFFKLNGRQIEQPQVGSYQYTMDGCNNIRTMCNSYYVSVPSSIRLYYDFCKGDVVRWSAEILGNREVGLVSVQYVRKK